MPELQRLRADHAPAVLAFELANRAYFATFISDRGNEFYDHFTEQWPGPWRGDQADDNGAAPLSL